MFTTSEPSDLVPSASSTARGCLCRSRSAAAIIAAGAAFGALLFTCATARAESASPASADDGAATTTTATVAATADPSGVLVPDDEPAASPARALLVVPRTTVAALVYPVSGGLALSERYHLREHLVDLFFNDARTFGIYPTVALETKLPTGAGLRLVDKDLFGTGGQLRLAADYGGESRHRLEGALTSPKFAAGLLRARLVGGWIRQPSAPFFGIGDQDLVAAAGVPDTLPARSPFAVASTFSQDVAHLELAAVLDPAGPLFAALSTAYFERTFRDTAIDPTMPTKPANLSRTDVRFDPATLTGWGTGTRTSYTELQLGWDSLVAAGPYVSPATPSTGTKLVAFAGLARGVGGSDVSYTRYGVDALRYFDLYDGDRVLIVRARLEGVAGADDRIPFTDLPRLGGPILLRGYDRDRFRDRVSMLASLEYRYPIWNDVNGFVFADAGRVLPDLAGAGHTVLAPQRLRPSGGFGLEVLNVDSVLVRLQAAGSSEGFFFQLALGPVYRLPTHNYRI